MTDATRHLLSRGYIAGQVKEAVDDLVHPLRNFKDGFGWNRARSPKQAAGSAVSQTGEPLGESGRFGSATQRRE